MVSVSRLASLRTSLYDNNENEKTAVASFIRGHLKSNYGISFRDAIHTHFVTVIGKWTIVGGWVKHRVDKRGKVGKIKS